MKDVKRPQPYHNNGNSNNKNSKKSNANNKKGDSQGKIKKRIRDLKRALKNGPKTAKAKIESERRLRALDYELGEKYIDDHQEKLYQKYRTVKFLELKKAQRRVKTAKKAVEEAETIDEKEQNKLQEALNKARINELYILHYPKTLPYISLYASNEEKTKQNEKGKSKIEANKKLQREILDKVQQILDKGGDMNELSKEYRERYREMMVEKGNIPAVQPLVDEHQDQSAEQNQTVTENDDFFA
ncbi:hypothetical protein BDC45DRAFT_539652 [Circinella umbellata]|nr:hypothetical protein BDC45DRAFT_539652 [Circinella umbellata]